MHGGVLPTLQWSLSLQVFLSGNVPKKHAEVCFLDSSKSSQVESEDKAPPWRFIFYPFSL